MKKLILSFLFLFSLLSLQATHNRSGEILYTRIPPFSTVTAGVTVPVYTYSITLITYTDNGPGIADRCEDTIYFGDGAGNGSVMQRISFPGSPGELSNCNCGAGVGCGAIIVNAPNYVVKKNVYSVIHTYSGTGTYVLSFTDPNRNAGIVNIPNAVNQPFSIQSMIIISGTTGANSSPVLSNPPVDRGYLNTCLYHNPAAYDVDGDSLSYELVPCIANGYSFPDAGANGSIGINNNGLFAWCNPQAVGEYAIAIKVSEWRKESGCGPYRLIGFVIRDMQTIVLSGTPPVPVLTPLSDTCVIAGSILTRTFSDNIQVPVNSAPAIYGSCAHSQFPATLGSSPTSSLYIFSWRTSCELAQQQPHQVELVYTLQTSAPNGPDPRAYRPFKVKIVPPAPQVYSVTRDTGSITLRWHKPAGCQDLTYNVYRKAGASGWAHGACETGVPASSGYHPVFLATADSSFTDVFLQPYANGSAINYIVTSTTKDCMEGFAESTQTLSVLVGIQTVPQDLVLVSVYPNPFSGSYEISTGSKTIPHLQATLYTADGRIVHDEAYINVNDKVRMQPTGLDAGIYVLRLKTAKGSLYKKLVKE